MESRIDDMDDYELLDGLIQQQAMILIAASTAAVNSDAFFSAQEALNDDQQYVDASQGVKDQLVMIRNPSLFKTMTNFTCEEFEELSQLVCPVIALTARTTGEIRGLLGRQPKLSPQQRLLHFVLYLKHDNTVIFDSHCWNWSKSSACDDALFVASCINTALAHEIRWPSAEERRRLAARTDVKGCLGFIDGTLVEIRRPSSKRLSDRHQMWYNGHMSMYCVSNTVIVDHDGLFIYIDPGYPGSFHDVNCLRRSELYQNWREYFEHTDQYFEYLLGDPGYIGEEMFVMHRIRPRTVRPGQQMDAVDAFNAVHGGIRVRVEWGIGGMKRKWRKLMKKFDCTIQKFPHYFRACAILTNFIQRRRLDMTATEMNAAPDDNDWDDEDNVE